MKHYRVYGLVVESEVDIPEACEYGGLEEPDVRIELGIMPDYIQKMKAEGSNIGYLGKEYYWYSAEDDADFLIIKGYKIIIEPCHDYDERSINSYLLGFCMSKILYQRDIIVVHGSSVERNGKAIILTGNPGMGKSTLTTELRKSGSRFMADDMVAIIKENGTYYACPGYPQQKLCRDAAIDFGYDLNKLVMLNEEREKYAIPLKDDYYDEKVPLSMLVVLEAAKCQECRFELVSGNQKLNLFINNLYSNSTYEKASMNTELFMQCLEIVNNLKVLHVCRPEEVNTVREIADAVLSI